MKPLEANSVKLDDTFELFPHMPKQNTYQAEGEGLSEWCAQSAQNLSEYFYPGRTALIPLWEKVLKRYLKFWWAVEKYKILTLYGTDFVRYRLVYGILGQDPRASLLRADEMRRVLVLGETGTGKEIVSSLIGNVLVEPSRYQADDGHLRLSAAEFTDTLLQAELFGYESGAFTGASEKNDGILGTMPDGGILFLDELGEASDLVQAQLLRVLQTGEYRSVGSTKPKSKNFHFIGATNIEETKLASGVHIRKDLYHRISQYVVTLPPLRLLVENHKKAKRVFDTLLAHEFHRFSRSLEKTMSIAPNLESAKKVDTKTRSLLMVQGNYHNEFEQAGVSRKIEKMMRGYSWPGNLRECSNLLRRIIQDGPASVARHCQAHRKALGEEAKLADHKDDWPPSDLKTYLAQAEKKAYLSTAENSKSIGEIARRLGVTRQTASRKLHAYGIRTGRTSGSSA